MFKIVLVSLVAALVACGDAAEGTTYRGKRLAALEVDVDTTFYSATPGTALAIALLWQVPDSDSAWAAAEDSAVAIDVGAPARVTLDVFQAPARELEGGRDGVRGTLAIGQVVAFEDADGDARWRDGEAIVGIAFELVVYSADGASGAPLGLTFAPGLDLALANDCAVAPEPRFRGAHEGPLTLSISPKGGARFALTCPPPPTYPCTGLDVIRATCQADASDAVCTRCPGAWWPVGADLAACDAWRTGCEATYDPSECGGEWKACTSGLEPVECDEACACANAYAICIKEGTAEETCAAAQTACLAR